ncbi:MAG: hypothetical protein WDO13_06325 [Verrucomicrobiota bacterium]
MEQPEDQRLALRREQLAAHQPRSRAALRRAWCPRARGEPSAEKIARQYYEGRGFKDFKLILDHHTPVENSTAFNPENGAQLTEPKGLQPDVQDLRRRDGGTTRPSPTFAPRRRRRCSSSSRTCST